MRPFLLNTEVNGLFGAAAHLAEVNDHRSIRIFDILQGALGETAVFQFLERITVGNFANFIEPSSGTPTAAIDSEFYRGIKCCAIDAGLSAGNNLQTSRSTFDLTYEQWNRCFVPLIHCQIDRILAELRQFQLLENENKTRRDGRLAAGKLHPSVRIQSGHDRRSIRIDKGNPDTSLSLFESFESQLDRQGALRMGHGRFLRGEPIKRAQDVQLAAGISRGRVAQSKNFYFHEIIPNIVDLEAIS